MRKRRRRFGDWELYTGYPVTLGYKPAGAAKGFIYHVDLRTCRTQEEYEDWLRHLAEKGFDVRGFKLAIDTLRAEGQYLKPPKDKERRAEQ